MSNQTQPEMKLPLASGVDTHVTYLTGSAPKEILPVPLTITGDIKSVRLFLEKRFGMCVNIEEYQCVDAGRAIITVDRENMTIHLDTDPNSIYNTSVTGKLELDPKLVEFDINGRSTMNRREVVDLLRFSAMHFPDGDEYRKVLGAFQNLKLTSSGGIEDSSDNRGNVNAIVSRAVDSQHVPTGFKLRLPIFKNEPPVVFDVEICLQADPTSAKFWFESPMLAELIEVEKDRIINNQLKDYLDKLVVIYK